MKTFEIQRKSQEQERNLKKIHSLNQSRQSTEKEKRRLLPKPKQYMRD